MSPVVLGSHGVFQGSPGVWPQESIYQGSYAWVWQDNVKKYRTPSKEIPKLRGVSGNRGEGEGVTDVTVDGII